MFKKSLPALLLIASLSLPVVSFAQTATSTSDLQLLIQQLQDQVRQLKAQIVQLNSEVEAVKTELKFTKALQRGATGDEVKELQEFLKKFPDIYPEGLVTGYFGPRTEEAVKKFQEKQGIEAIGVIGPKTLNKLNELVTEGAGESGVVPPGLLTAPGLQGRLATTTPAVATTSQEFLCAKSAARCATQKECTASGFYWYTVSCHSNPPPAYSCPASYNYCVSSAECSAHGWYWCRNSCYGSADACLGQTYTPPAQPPSIASTTVSTPPPAPTTPPATTPAVPTVSVSGQATPAWVRLIGTSAVETGGAAIAVDGSNNVYTVGDTWGTLDGSNIGLDDAFIAKYDSSGNKLWVRQVGSIYGDVFKAVAIDASNNSYAVGLTYKSVDGQVHFGNTDALIVKYDSSGTKLWTRQFGASLNDQLYGAVTDFSGNVYAAGLTDTSLDGQTSAGLMDALLVKYDSNGNKLWTRLLGTSDYDRADGSIGMDGSGNVYMAGWTRKTLSGQTSAGQDDAFIAKYDTDGNRLWVRQWGGASNDDAFALTVSGNNVYAVGQTNSSLDGQTSQGGYDAFVTKYDTNGNKVWTRQFGSSASDAAEGVAADAAGNVYVGGHTDGSFGGQTNAGGTDAFVVEYDSNGNNVWTKLLGSSANDAADSSSGGVAVDRVGNVYISGSTWGSLGGQINAGGGGDVFIAKYTQDQTVTPTPAPAPTPTTPPISTTPPPSTSTTTTTTDTTPPTVSISEWSPSISYSIITSFSITSSDNVGVVGIQVKKNGVSFGSEIVATSTASLPSPYEIPWDTINEANGTYTFSAVVRDAAGNTTTGYATTITKGSTTTTTTTATTTTTTTDTTPPVISNVQPTNITAVSANINWTTDKTSDSQVEYGLTTSYGALTTLDTFLSTTHSVHLTGLTVGATYHYRVKSKDTNGYYATMTDFTFTTATDTTAPVISNIQATNITQTSATITWTTDELSGSRVYYSINSNVSISSVLYSVTDGFVTNHSVALNGLVAGTTYYYIASSWDASGNYRDSSSQSFITATTATTTSSGTQSSKSNLAALLSALLEALQKLQELLK